jgi:hypothetical protein
MKKKVRRPPKPKKPALPTPRELFEDAISTLEMDAERLRRLSADDAQDLREANELLYSTIEELERVADSLSQEAFERGR